MSVRKRTWKLERRNDPRRAYSPGMSQIQASLANHSCVSWHSGHKTWLKNTGVNVILCCLLSPSISFSDR